MNELPRPYYQDSAVTIYNADCREILPLLPKVDLVLTDPPYGVGLKYGTYEDLPDKYWEWFIPALNQLRNYCSSVVFTHRQASLKQLKDWDHLCIWSKPFSYGYAINGWLAHWEPIFVYGINPQCKLVENRKAAHFDVYTIPVAKNDTGHPCPKPLKLMTALIETFLPSVLLDPFMGSGTTLRAAKDLGRKAIGIEIEEKYCEIAAKRMGQEVFAL